MDAELNWGSRSEGGGTPPPGSVVAVTRVLVIEDRTETARILAEALRRSDDRFEVTAVASVTAGLELIDKGGLDCVLLDYRLPDGDGLDCLRRIRQKWPDLPVIMITAAGSEDVAATAMKLGASDYVVKHGNYLGRVLALVREAVVKREVSRATTRLAHGVFVGRTSEMEAVRALIDDALVGHGHLVLIEGEAGIGKTELVRQAAMYAGSRDFRVLWGRCHEKEIVPMYWPWSQIIRTCVQESSIEEPRELGTAAAAIAQLAPDLGERLGATADPSAKLEPEQARFRLFDGISSYLRNVTRRRPTLIVLDDLHEADECSLQLLQFVVRELEGAPLLVICAYRDRGSAIAGATDGAIASLRRDASFLYLSGLSENEVREQIATISGQNAPKTFVRTIFHRTRGNPLFVEEILRHLVREGVVYHDGVRWTARSAPGEMPIPDGVRDLAAKCVALLSDGCREVLSVASVIGREFELDAVATASEKTVECVGELMDEAVAGRVIVQVAGSVDEFAFAHELVPQVLYDDLPLRKRSEVHRRVAERLERLHTATLDLQAGAIAYHFFRSADADSGRKAVDYALRAARRAAELMAHEEAARLYETALTALAKSRPAETGERVEILLKMSESWWRAGEAGRARCVARQAVEISRVAGSAADFARAALTHAGELPGFRAVACDDGVVQLLEEALKVLGEGESALHARVLGRLAEEITFSHERERRRVLAKQAVEMARRFGEPSVLASVLKNMHWALWTPDKLEKRLALANEFVSLARTVGDQSMQFDGHLFRCFAKLELGGMPAVLEEFAACSRLALELKQPYQSSIAATAGACLALAQGRLDEVEELARRALELGRQAQNPNAGLFYAVQMGHLLWLRGRFEDLDALSEGLGQGNALLLPTLGCARAVRCCELGRLDEARFRFEELARDDFAPVPRDVAWPQNATFLAQVCASLRDAPRAAQLYAQLRPFEGRVIVLAPVLPWGAASHYLGLLAATMGRLDLARRHFEDALATNARTGCSQWLARTELAYAELLLDGGGDDERERALALLTESAQIAKALGMHLFTRRVCAVLDGARGMKATEDRLAPETRGDSAPGRERDTSRGDISDECLNVFRRESAYWTIVHEGRRCLLPDSKGLRLLAVLLDDPGREFYVFDLACGAEPVWTDVKRGPVVDRSEAGAMGIEGDLGPLLDRRATREYRHEIESLKEQLDEAVEFNDTEKACRLREQVKMFADQLAEAVGLGGRNRPIASPEDRLRQRVRKNIKAAIEAIREVNPSLGHHLDTHVKTGRYCSYSADPEHPLRWTT